MKILMLEHFQGRGQPTLKKGEEYESVKPKLRDWLIEHGKAVEVKPEAPEPVVVEEKPVIKEKFENLFSKDKEKELDVVPSGNDEPLEEVTEENKDIEKESPVKNVMQSPKPKKQPKKPTKKSKRKGGK